MPDAVAKLTQYYLPNARMTLGFDDFKGIMGNPSSPTPKFGLLGATI